MPPFPSVGQECRHHASTKHKALVTAPQPPLLRRAHLRLVDAGPCVLQSQLAQWRRGASNSVGWGVGLAAARQVTTLWEVPVSRPGSRGHYRSEALPKPRRYKVSTDLTRALAKTLPELARTRRFLGQAVLSDVFLTSS